MTAVAFAHRPSGKVVGRAATRRLRERCHGRAVVGGPSGPMPFGQFAAI
ncbi:DUF6053 domain-containing protein [Lysobacter enzymogenes]